MTDLPVQASLSFDVRYMRKGKHSVVLFLPELYHPLIGLVVVYWGNFEVVFNSCLEGLIAAEQSEGATRDVENWKRWKFKRRWTLFKKICNEWLRPWNDNAASQLSAILDSAAHLQSRRNLITHGIYGFTIAPHSSVALNCYALNTETGERMPFDEGVLKKIYHDISHATADLVMAFRAIGEVEGPFHALPDSEILRIYRETSHPWNPNPNRRTNEA